MDLCVIILSSKNAIQSDFLRFFPPVFKIFPHHQSKVKDFWVCRPPDCWSAALQIEWVENSEYRWIGFICERLGRHMTAISSLWPHVRLQHYNKKHPLNVSTFFDPFVFPIPRTKTVVSSTIKIPDRHDLSWVLLFPISNEPVDLYGEIAETSLWFVVTPNDLSWNFSLPSSFFTTRPHCNCCTCLLFSHICLNKGNLAETIPFLFIIHFGSTCNIYLIGKRW